MTTNYEKMCDWEIQKSAYLVLKAKQLGMHLDGYGELAVNSNSGNTYLWLEDYNFSLFMPINCELTDEDVFVNYFDHITGNEIEEQLSEFSSIDEINKWISTLETKN